MRMPVRITLLKTICMMYNLNKSMYTNRNKKTSSNQQAKTGQQNFFATEGNRRFLPKSKISLSISQPIIQTKLFIGKSDNQYEVEADRIADQVVSMPNSNVISNTQSGPIIQKKCASCSEEKKIQKKSLSETISPIVQRAPDQTKTSGVATHDISSRINKSNGSGHGMDRETKGFMESRFGTDFSSVRLHTDSNAKQLSNELSAQAFTVGNDIYFNEGKYQPSSHSGKHLLAHELTHSIQQRKSNYGDSTSPQRQVINSNENLIQRTMDPPGDCEWSEYIPLTAAVEAAKMLSQDGDCDDLFNCGSLISETLAITAEVTARIARETKCFRGGDQGHRERISNLMGKLDVCMVKLFFECAEGIRREAEEAIEKVREMFEKFMRGVLSLAIIVLVIVAIIVLAKLLAAAAAGAAVGAVIAAIVLILVGVKDIIGSDDESSA